MNIMQGAMVFPIDIFPYLGRITIMYGVIIHSYRTGCSVHKLNIMKVENWKKILLNFIWENVLLVLLECTKEKKTRILCRGVRGWFLLFFFFSRKSFRFSKFFVKFTVLLESVFFSAIIASSFCTNFIWWCNKNRSEWKKILPLH